MRYKNIFSLLVSGVVLLSTACQDFVEDVNISPNSPTDAPLANIIVATQVNFGAYMEGEDARLAGMWTQQFTGVDRQYAAINNYTVSTEGFDWFFPYVGVLQQADLAIAKAEELENRSTAGMLKVIQAAMFGTMTSLYGDIPFTEALQGPDLSDPAYDDQATVYAGVQAMLDEAIADLSTEQGAIITDILGGGNKTTWLEAAHTYKARFYLHVGDHAKAAEHAGQGISSPANNITIKHGDVNSGNMNLYYDFLELNRSGYLLATNAVLPRLLDETSDTYRGNAKTDDSVRFEHIYTVTDAGYELNTAEGGMFAMNAPFTLLSFRENQLILAESLLRLPSADAEGALAALNSVRAANNALYDTNTEDEEDLYEAYVLSDFDPETGIANTGQATAEAALLQEILEEKYVVLVGQIEAFNDLRRTDNALGIVPVTGSQLPQRFLYPTSEVTANENFPGLEDLFTATDVNM
ncbi:MAG: SusD/RagB family nutrient-binding outer membrane lipoprotein [Bacteroidetes bacterium]|nr:SusD/RagB family nutrient-binding outer membrane lipoprotein [Bacteroidota bacterium]